MSRLLAALPLLLGLAACGHEPGKDAAAPAADASGRATDAATPAAGGVAPATDAAGPAADAVGPAADAVGPAAGAVTPPANVVARAAEVVALAAEAVAGGAGGQSCVGCHAKVNPGLVADHLASPHARAGVKLACKRCHGEDHEQMFRVKGAVPPTTCAACHPEAYEAFAASRHGMRLREGKMDALLASASPAAGGCTATNGCHSIQKVYRDGSVGRCSACHVSHAFANEPARRPRVCVGCHGGVDHPQYRAWLRSSHSLPAASGSGPIAGCVECHDRHDVSTGIVHGLPPGSGEPLSAVPHADPAAFTVQRAIMVERCRKCHTGRFSRRALEEADRWRYRGALLLDRAQRLVRALQRDGLLQPAPGDRVANPVAGHGLRLGGAQVFDVETSLAERIYYEMHFQHYPALWRAAYHTDPARISWEGNDALKSALNRLMAIDRALRAAAPVSEEILR